MIKKITIISAIILVMSLSLGCFESNKESEYEVHLWVTNQRSKQYSNISVRIDSDYSFDVTAISGTGHTYYYDNLTLSKGEHKISVYEHDTNTSVIMNLPYVDQFKEMKFDLDNEIWLVVSFWTNRDDIEEQFFQVTVHDKAPGIA